MQRRDHRGGAAPKALGQSRAPAFGVHARDTPVPSGSMNARSLPRLEKMQTPLFDLSMKRAELSLKLLTRDLVLCSPGPFHALI